ncbi:MAG: hypothetical protein KC416_05640, partial [Myxococcales bacterium]|nr:hypothetical protein [Myxococcales bacterium]
MLKRCTALLWLALVAVACDGSEAVSLEVRLRTDYAPVSEFDEVVVALRKGNRAVRNVPHTANRDFRYEDGTTVARFSGLETGEYTLVMDLFLKKAPVASREARVAVRNSSDIDIAVWRRGPPPVDGGTGGDGGPDGSVPERFRGSDPLQIIPQNPDILRRLSGTSAVQTILDVTTNLESFPPMQAEGSCPRRVVSGNKTTFTGGCIDGEGVTWKGTLIQTGNVPVRTGSIPPVNEKPEDLVGTLEFSSWSAEWVQICMQKGEKAQVSITGSVVVTSPGPGIAEFEIDVERKGAGNTMVCTPIPPGGYTEYSGKLEGATLGESLFQGEGLRSWNDLGFASSRTVDELVSFGSCVSRAQSGRTEVEAQGGRLTFEYNAAMDGFCDPEKSALVSFNGKKQP